MLIELYHIKKNPIQTFVLCKREGDTLPFIQLYGITIPPLTSGLSFVFVFRNLALELGNLDEFPFDKSEKAKNSWIEKKMDLIEQYKKSHPNYKEEIRMEETKKNSK